MISTYEIGTLLPQIECANVRRFFELTMKEIKIFLIFNSLQIFLFLRNEKTLSDFHFRNIILLPKSGKPSLRFLLLAHQSFSKPNRKARTEKSNHTLSIYPIFRHRKSGWKISACRSGNQRPIGWNCFSGFSLKKYSIEIKTNWLSYGKPVYLSFWRKLLIY